MTLRNTDTKLDARTLEEASTWVLEFSVGEVGVADRERFNHWLRRSPEHVQAYLQIAALWEDTAVLGKRHASDPAAVIQRAQAEENVVVLQPLGVIEAAKPGGSDQMPSLPASAPPGVVPLGQAAARSPSRGDSKFVPRARPGSGLSLAASILVVISAAWGWWYTQRGTYATDTGEHRSIVLSDGSTIELNARSRVRVRYNSTARDIELLGGQALFQVAKDPARPFVVTSESTRVRAVGTQFDIDRRTSGTTVTVLEGRVAVVSTLLNEPRPRDEARAHEGPPLPPNAPTTGQGISSVPSVRVRGSSSAEHLSDGSKDILLAAGEQLTVAPKAAARPMAVNVADATAWTRRQFVFRSTPLTEVIEEYNRYHERRLLIRDPSLANIPISGVFSATNEVALITFLRTQPNLLVVDTGNAFEIRAQ